MNRHDTFINVDGKRLFARSWEPENSDGALAPIILFHDSLGCVDLWRRFPAVLSEATQRRVIAYDRYGYGKSDPYPGEQPPDFVSREAEVYFPALRQQLGIDRFVALGHSVGGGMAANCAVGFPDSCEGLITIAAQAFVEDRTLQGIRDAEIAFASDSHMERLKKYHGDNTEWVLNAWITTWFSEAFSTWNLKELMPQVRCPVLAIHGSEDEYGSLKHPQIISGYAGGPSTMKILEGCKHVPHREEETKVIEFILDFLDG